MDSLLPIIGGDVGDALELVGANAQLIKSATGATGLMLLLSLTAGPMIELAGVMFLTRLAAAVTEPIETGRAQKMMAQFSEVLGLMVASVATAALIALLVTGALRCRAMKIRRAAFHRIGRRLREPETVEFPGGSLTCGSFLRQCANWFGNRLRTGRREQYGGT